MKICLLTILFSLNTYSQKDSVHIKGLFSLNNTYSILGQIELSNIGKPENDTRFAYAIKLRGHYFIENKIAIGIGLKYWDFYYHRDEPLLELNKPFNGELYLRYFPFRKLYLETSVLYGGFVRDSFYLNQLNWIGALGIGFETKIKGNLFLDLNYLVYYPLEKNSWVKSFGQEGIGYIGFTYYFRNNKNRLVSKPQ